MKVLFITPNYPAAEGSYKGIFIKELAEALQKSGIEIRIVHLQSIIVWPFSLLSKYRILNEADSLSSIPLIRHGINTFPRAFGIITLSKFAGKKIGKKLQYTWPDYHPDIINAHTFIPGALVAQPVASVYKCPIVVTTHGADTRVWLHRFLGIRAMLDISKKQAVSIVCVSKTIENILLQKQFPAEKCSIIPNGLDKAKLYSGSDSIKNGYSGKTLILGVGNLSKNKGFDLLIRAVHSLHLKGNQIHGIIVGEGSERESLKKMIVNLHVDNVIELAGAKSPEVTMMYMAACDIFCLPSWSEGFGMVYLEAMANGKPVVAVEGQGIADTIKQAGAGYCIQPGDVQGLEKCLQLLIDNSDERRRMGSRGRILVDSKFTWEQCAIEYKKKYNEVLEKYALA